MAARAPESLVPYVYLELTNGDFFFIEYSTSEEASESLQAFRRMSGGLSGSTIVWGESGRSGQGTTESRVISESQRGWRNWWLWLAFLTLGLLTASVLL